MSFRVAIIGCGRPGRGQARGHLRGYAHANCTVVGLADIVEENAVSFREEFSLTEAATFTDYAEMLATTKPDVVSVCLWPHLHAPAVEAAAAAGVRAIHCEKPMAPTWGECKRMAAACEGAGAQLTFNHQRRFGKPFQHAKAMLDAGTIGTLQRMEANTYNLFDWGTHWFDMMSYFNGDEPAEWVLGQMEWRGTKALFGAPIEPQGLSHFRFASGVHGLMVTGPKHEVWGARIRLIGSEGVIELGAPGADGGTEGIPLRYWNGATSGWEVVDIDEHLHAPECYERTIADVLACLESGEEPLLSARRALIGTELIFATYESSRRRGRVDLPLTEEDSALVGVLKENGALPEDSLVR